MDHKELAQQNLAIFAAGNYTTPSGQRIDIAAGLARAVAGTRRFRAEEPPPAPAGPAPRVEITPESTTEAIHRLVAEGAGDVAALNFASALKPGGGFLGGARAQEEDLARASGLYACLEPQRDFYADNKRFGSALYLDDLLYSPAVPFFRDDDLRLVAAPVTAAIITSAAPNAGALADQRHDADVPGALRRRARAIIRVAAAHGHRTLLLGAWGCGVFRNDPDKVSAAFAEVLGVEGAGFARVVFAVFERGARIDATAKGRAFLRLAKD